MFPSPAIFSTALTKSFGRVRAVRNLSLSIPSGILYGLVGPDGAGKSTAIRMLTGIMEPEGGEAWIDGISVREDPEGVKERIGYMSQRFGLYEDLTVMENLLFYADLYAVPRRARTERIARLLAFSRLETFGDRLAGALSGGMKQKLGLACALVHTPRVLFLDEPTNGVDPVSRRDFWKILYDLLREEVSIFVSTSYLDEAERCGRVGLMHAGSIVREDSPEAIRRSYPLPVIEVWCDDVRGAGEIVENLDGIAGVSIYGDRLHVMGESMDAVTAALGTLRSRTVDVHEHREILPSLEDVFISLVAGSGGTGGPGGD